LSASSGGVAIAGRQPEPTGDKTMKKNMFQLAALCLLAFTSTLAQAQSRITVKVPFNFLISDRTFPAGQYSVSSSRNQLTVQDSTGKSVFIGIANPVSGRRVGETGQVVFHCYENRCFLSEFWTPTRENGNQLLPSRYEAELAKHRKGMEFALLEQPQRR
jgi:hypothetical protein